MIRAIGILPQSPEVFDDLIECDKPSTRCPNGSLIGLDFVGYWHDPILLSGHTSSKERVGGAVVCRRSRSEPGKSVKGEFSQLPLQPNAELNSDLILGSDARFSGGRDPSPGLPDRLDGL